ncbi:LysR family transcriptional regulator [Xanthobacter dioxanivorans]|uniref:LysR family transcriptional regulator n=1 Tax=Xanthobacter dioxanivorans TaxID=2528964 RepID=A0A974PRC9_9HYPH|nr:LysR substrate-binding domain-containing protein [Xanthobacter dioxanivorans]QRG08308.1 LysR family transcriptional regulator [Xanthobacter dioxanivorans]
MLDMDLLKAFVSVVDAGGFTRAGARVHRTQSTVSQQIRRLEDQLGHQLLVREARGVALTAEGERLLGYARRILALGAEAQAALAGTMPARVVRLGIPDDFALAALTSVIADFARARPGVRLAVECGLSRELFAAFARGDLDLVLHKREPGSGPAAAVWPEQLLWVTGRDVEPDEACAGLVAFRQGCLYRNRAVHALEAAGRPWRIAYECASLIGIEAALAGGLGVAVLSQWAVSPRLRVLAEPDRWPPIPPTELALLVDQRACAATRDLAGLITAFCDREAGCAAAA